MDDEKPDTRHLVVKAKVVEVTDRPASVGGGEAISVRLIHEQNRVAEARAAKGEGILSGAPFALPAPELFSGFKIPEIVPLDPPAQADDESAICVRGLLLENRIAEERSEWGRLVRWKRRKSRRTRDFLIFVGGADLALVVAMKAMPSGVTMVYGISGITLLTTVGWIMFVVMDDYCGRGRKSAGNTPMDFANIRR